MPHYGGMGARPVEDGVGWQVLGVGGRWDGSDPWDEWQLIPADASGGCLLPFRAFRVFRGHGSGRFDDDDDNDNDDE